jgi:hypothetical protein
MNMGTQVAELLKSQGFDHNDYGRVSMYSTSTGVRMMLYTYTKNATHIYIDRDSNNTYTISKGLKPGNNTVLATNIAEVDLLKTFEKNIKKA